MFPTFETRILTLKHRSNAILQVKSTNFPSQLPTFLLLISALKPHIFFSNAYFNLMSLIVSFNFNICFIQIKWLGYGETRFWNSTELQMVNLQWSTPHPSTRRARRHLPFLAPHSPGLWGLRRWGGARQFRLGGLNSKRLRLMINEY